MHSWFHDWRDSEKEFEELKKTATLYHRFQDNGGNILYLKCYAIKETKCGVWVKSAVWEKPHWMNTGHRKRYAYQNIEDAWESFTRRKAKQFTYLSREYNACQNVLGSIKEVGGDLSQVVNSENGYNSRSACIADDFAAFLAGFGEGN